MDDKPARKPWNVAAAVVLTAVAIVWIALASGGEDDGGARDDRVAEQACRKFAELARDYPTLTDEQYVERAQSLHRTARASNDQAIAEAAEAMTTAAIRGSDAEQAEAINALGSACKSAGHLSG